MVVMADAHALDDLCARARCDRFRSPDVSRHAIALATERNLATARC